MEPSLKEVLSHFQTQGEVVSCERYGCGHINETYLAVTDTGRRYILQKLSNRLSRILPVCRRMLRPSQSICTASPPIPGQL